MKMKLLIGICLIVSAVPLGADDFKTIDGKEYKNATVSRVEPDGIVIAFSGGIVKLQFGELSTDIQKKYGYDSESAATYTAEQNEKQVALRQQQKEEENKRTEERHKYWSEHATPAATQAQTTSSRTQNAGLSGSMLDQRPPSGPQWLIQGRVGQFVNGGILVHTMFFPAAGAQQMHGGSTVYVAGKFDGFADGDLIKLIGQENGHYEYETTTGANAHVRAFVVTQLIPLPPPQW